MFYDEEQVQKLIGEHEALTHDVYRLFDELSEDQLGHMKMLMQFVMAHGSPRVGAALLVGHIEGKLSSRFDICLACGKNHATEIGLPPIPKDFDPTFGSEDYPEEIEGDDA